MEELYESFAELSNREKWQLMIDALDLMEQHNGRSKKFCIATAYGVPSEEPEDGTIKLLW